MQITDLHVSEYVDPKRITQLEQFCTETVETIRPAVVISSGDLTDAKTPWGSYQHEWEWKEYARILREKDHSFCYQLPVGVFDTVCASRRTSGFLTWIITFCR